MAAAAREVDSAQHRAGGGVGQQGRVQSPDSLAKGAGGLRVGCAVHGRGQRPSVVRVDDDPVHAVVDDRADSSGHRRDHHRHAGGQRLDGDTANEVPQRREHERLAGLERALEAGMVHRSQEGNRPLEVPAAGQLGQCGPFRAVPDDPQHARAELVPVGRDPLDQQVDSLSAG